MTRRDTACRIALLTILAASLALPAAAAVPEGVSPGSPSRLAPVEARCPTFNWGAVPGTARYELVAYTLPGAEELAAGGELLLGEDAEVLFAAVPGSATGWTPSADRCLAPGGRYVWFVRSVVATEPNDAAEPGEWSEGLYFTVVTGLEQGQGWGESAPMASARLRSERQGGATEKGVDPWVLKAGDVMTGPLGVNANGLNLLSLVTRDDQTSVNVTKLEVRSPQGAPLLTVDSEGDLTAASLSGGSIAAGQVSVGGSTVIDAGGNWVGPGDTLPCSGCVSTSDLADGSVTSAKIANGTVYTTDLHDDSVTTAKIVNGTIQTADLANSAVTSAKIAAGAVGGTDLADLSVFTNHLVDGGITTPKIANGAVTSSKIAAGAVTGTAIANGSIASQDIADGTLTAADISPTGGVYSTRDAVYTAYDAVELLPNQQKSVKAECNDENDLPIGGGCTTEDPQTSQLVLVSSHPIYWTSEASHWCSFRNEGAVSQFGIAEIYCINVP